MALFFSDMDAETENKEGEREKMKRGKEENSLEGERDLKIKEREGNT